MSQTSRGRFGIMTAPSQVEYDDVLRVWREADMIPEIEHAWLFDHLMPIFGNPDGPTYEGWTLLSAECLSLRVIMRAVRTLLRRNTTSLLSPITAAGHSRRRDRDRRSGR
jgi:hypothetical protein